MWKYVHPNVVMKPLHELCKTPLYANAHVSIRRDWEDITSLANVNENDGLDELSFVNLSSSINKDKFEEVLNEDPTNPLVQNILNVEQITFDNNEHCHCIKWSFSTLRFILW